MKLILTWVFILFSVEIAFCQTEKEVTAEANSADLKREILQMKEDSRQVQMHLYRAHRIFRTGTIFYTLGLGMAFLAATNENTAPSLVLLGSGFLAAGGILHIDSHKHIGRAGMIDFKRR